MKVFDEKFRNNKIRYVLQCLLAAVSVFIILLFLNAISDAVIVAALGASAFIAFAMPEAQVSRPRFLIGGYLVGIAVGWPCYRLSLIPTLTSLPVVNECSDVIFGALAVGLSIFIMVVTDTEHPPAAGLALGLTVGECTHRTILAALIGIVSLSIVKRVLRPVLRNLL